MKFNRFNYFIQGFVFKNESIFENLNHVIVDLDKKLIFNRIPKNANTYVCNIIFNNLGPVAVKDGKSVKKHGPNLRNTLLLEDIKNFRRLLVVRDPAARALSAFLDKFRKQKYQKEYGDFSLDLDGFVSFLDWLEDGGLSKNRHWDLQKNVIAFDLDFFTDVIPMEEMFRLHAYLKQLGYPIDSLNITKIYDDSNRHKTGSSQRSDILENNYLRDRIRKIYAEDYRFLEAYYK